MRTNYFGGYSTRDIFNNISRAIIQKWEMKIETTFQKRIAEILDGENGRKKVEKTIKSFIEVQTVHKSK